MRPKDRRNQKRRSKKIFDLDITSLLDILVIILVFLLKSYNSSNVILNIAKDINLPPSNSRSINTPGIMVQVAEDKIWVEEKLIFDRATASEMIYDHDGRRIVALYNELMAIKSTVEAVSKAAPEATKFSGKANLIVDKKIRYSMLKKVMYTLATAGLQKYKFVVRGVEGS